MIANNREQAFAGQVARRFYDLVDQLARIVHQLHRAAQAESDRAELEVKSKEEEREKIKRQMNAPKLSNREYEMLQEAMAKLPSSASEELEYDLDETPYL